MEWEDRAESENVEDRRGMSGPAKAGIGLGGGGLLVLVVAMLLPPEYRKPFIDIFGGGAQQAPVQPGDDNKQAGPRDPEEEKQAKFTRVILKDTEDVWDRLFKEMDPPRTYKKPVLVLFTGVVDSACGRADSAVGPFYCPGDHRLYIDLSFFKDMDDPRKIGAPGEFARAYVVAHEVGHHVQNLLPTPSKSYSRIVDQHRGTPQEKRYSVRLELQADYLAGVWAHHVNKMYKDRYTVVNESDVKAGLNAAFKIGDDFLQKKARGRVVPDSFTHGTSKARAHWLMDGIRTGDFSKKKLDQFFTLPYDEVDVGLRGRGR